MTMFSTPANVNVVPNDLTVAMPTTHVTPVTPPPLYSTSGRPKPFPPHGIRDLHFYCKIQLSHTTSFK